VLIWGASLVAMFVAAIAYIRPSMFTYLNIYDEGVIVYGATRVMQGEMPYRDFWTPYSPGQFYTLAALFAAFGKTILVERWWDVASRALLSVSIYLVAAQLSSRITAMFVWALSVVWLAYYGFFGYPIFQGLAFSFLSLHCVLRSLMGDRLARKHLIFAGGFLGLTALFRHDMAIYVAIAESLVLFVFSASQRSSDNEPCHIKEPGLLSRVFPVLATALIVVAPVALFFLLTTPINELAQQLFIFPLIEFPKVRDLPYPPLSGAAKDLPFYVPFLIYGMAGLVASVRIGHMQTVRLELEQGLRDAKDWPEAKINQQRAQVWGVLLIILFGLLGFNQVHVRSDLIHTPHFFLAAMVLLPFIAQGFWQADKAWSFIVSGFAIGIALLLTVEPLDWHKTMMEQREKSSSLISQSLPIAAGTLMSDEQRSLVQHLQKTVKPGEWVYLGLTQHDRVFANDVMLYFLLEARSPTRYHELHPGLINTLPVQQEMVADLMRNPPFTVVLTSIFEGAREPNDSSKSSGVKLLDDYIKAHYRMSLIIGNYRVYRRK
jgi:uncharacterized membrane protein